MAESTNTTESGAPMLSPSRCSHCVESRNETSRLSKTLTLKFYLLLLLLHLQQALSSLHLLLPGLTSVAFFVK